ncbi:hypothetical protein M758_2G171600 [Ceratodon purpureus]|nr:hypothetical protein M758_2G171600 [Ceratodon purpureus]
MVRSEDYQARRRAWAWPRAAPRSAQRCSTTRATCSDAGTTGACKRTTRRQGRSAAQLPQQHHGDHSGTVLVLQRPRAPVQHRHPRRRRERQLPGRRAVAPRTRRQSDRPPVFGTRGPPR